MSNQHSIPGTLSGPYSQPNRRYIVDDNSILIATVRISTTASDAGHTAFRTTFLREGLALGRITAGGQYTHYIPGASDGTETIKAILNEGVDMLDLFGVARATPIMASVVIKGYVDATQVILIDAAGKTDLRNAGFTLLEDF